MGKPKPGTDTPIGPGVLIDDLPIKDKRKVPSTIVQSLEAIRIKLGGDSSYTCDSVQESIDGITKIYDAEMPSSNSILSALNKLGKVVEPGAGWEIAFDGMVETTLQEDPPFATSEIEFYCDSSTTSPDSIKVLFNGDEYVCERWISSGEYGDYIGYGAIAPSDPTTGSFDWSDYPFSIMSGTIVTEEPGSYNVTIKAKGQYAPEPEPFTQFETAYLHIANTTGGLITINNVILGELATIPYGKIFKRNWVMASTTIQGSGISFGQGGIVMYNGGLDSNYNKGSSIMVIEGGKIEGTPSNVIIVSDTEFIITGDASISIVPKGLSPL